MASTSLAAENSYSYSIPGAGAKNCQVASGIGCRCHTRSKGKGSARNAVLSRGSITEGRGKRAHRVVVEVSHVTEDDDACLAVRARASLALVVNSTVVTVSDFGPASPFNTWSSSTSAACRISPIPMWSACPFAGNSLSVCTSPLFVRPTSRPFMFRDSPLNIESCATRAPPVSASCGFHVDVLARPQCFRSSKTTSGNQIWLCQILDSGL
eukprot:102188-Rhodomonas_salina.1